MSRRAVLVVVALAVAALSTALLTVYVRGADDRAAAGSELQQVLVATQEIPVGTTGQQALDDGYVVLEELPRSAVLEGAMSDIPPSLRSLRLETRILPGEQLLTYRFTPTVESALGIPDGKMALSVELDDAARVAGNVAKDSEVAVFATLESGAGGGARLLLERVPVLQVGTPTELDAGPLLTLAVTQEEAQKLIFAQANGSLYVALLDDASVTSSNAPPADAGNLFPPVP